MTSSSFSIHPLDSSLLFASIFFFFYFYLGKVGWPGDTWNAPISSSLFSHTCWSGQSIVAHPLESSKRATKEDFKYLLAFFVVVVVLWLVRLVGTFLGSSRISVSKKKRDKLRIYLWEGTYRKEEASFTCSYVYRSGPFFFIFLKTKWKAAGKKTNSHSSGFDLLFMHRTISLYIWGSFVLKMKIKIKFVRPRRSSSKRPSCLFFWRKKTRGWYESKKKKE